MFRPIPMALGACAVLVVLVVLTLIDPARGRRYSRVVLVLWVGVILGVTMLGGSDGTGEENLFPGRTIYEQLTNFDHAGGVFNVIGNIALFVPLGWLLALIVRRRRLLVAAIAGFGLSAAIEVVQSLIGRVADIDDVILNGSGAVIGAGVAVLIRAMRDRATAAAGMSDEPGSP